MPQLPSARRKQNHNLGNAVPHRPAIRGLAEITEVRLSLPLVLLLPVYVLQLLVQVPDFCRKLRNMRAVLVRIGFGGPHYDIEVQPNVCAGEPRGVVCREANRVIPWLVGCEREPPIAGTFGLDDIMARLYFLAQHSNVAMVVFCDTTGRTSTSTQMPKFGSSAYAWACSDHSRAR